MLMPPPSGAKRSSCCEIRAVIPATFEAIEQLFDGFRNDCQCILQHQDYFAAELLMREALTNAVVHGSHGKAEKQVRCAFRMRGRRLLIAVEDDGEGFDWRDVRTREAEISSCCGRGMQIFRTYATRVRFNEKGNVVVILKDF